MENFTNVVGGNSDVLFTEDIRLGFTNYRKIGVAISNLEMSKLNDVNPYDFLMKYLESKPEMYTKIELKEILTFKCVNSDLNYSFFIDGDKNLNLNFHTGDIGKGSYLITKFKKVGN